MEHVAVLDRFIGNFRDYAEHSTRTCPFDVMLCAICCGHDELAKLMWKRCASPIRAALLANSFLHQLQRRTSGYARGHLDSDLMDYFKCVATDVIALLPAGLRQLVLLHVPEHKHAEAAISDDASWHGNECLGCAVSSTILGSRWLGKQWRRFRSTGPSHQPGLSIIEAGMYLKQESFLGAPDCKSLLGELWCGSSAK
jgi:hypothetical protein